MSQKPSSLHPMQRGPTESDSSCPRSTAPPSRRCKSPVPCSPSCTGNIPCAHSRRRTTPQTGRHRSSRGDSRCRARGGRRTPSACPRLSSAGNLSQHQQVRHHRHHHVRNRRAARHIDHRLVHQLVNRCGAGRIRLGGLHAAVRSATAPCHDCRRILRKLPAGSIRPSCRRSCSRRRRPWSARRLPPGRCIYPYCS